MNKIFVTLFYSGLFKYAPGTIGSIVAFILGFLLLSVLPKETILLATVAIGVVAGFEINKYQDSINKQDPKEVVIDELVGMWLAMVMVPFEPLSLIGAFIFFRLFDIKKPSIIGKVDKKMKNGFGVVLDDVLAGFFAGLVILLFNKIYLLSQQYISF